MTDEKMSIILGDPEVTANLYCNFVLGRLHDLQYIFAVTSGSPGTVQELPSFKDNLFFMLKH